MANVITDMWRKIFPRAEDRSRNGVTEAIGWGGFVNRLQGISFRNDLVDTVDRNAYEVIRRADATAQPMRKLAQRVSTMRVAVVGDGPGVRLLQELIDASNGLPEILEFLCWARIEGYRLARIDARKDGFGANARITADFNGTGRLKVKAGGFYSWTGWLAGDRVIKAQQNDAHPNSQVGQGSTTDAQPKELRRERFIVFSPFAGGNPEGDTDFAWNLYQLANDTLELDKILSRYSDRHGLPHEVFRMMVDKMQPDEVQTSFQAAADKIKQANARQQMVMSADDIFKLLEPSGATWQFLNEYRKQLEARCHKLILGENMTSDTSNAGPSGSTKNAEKQLNTSALSLARQLSEALSRDLIPFYIKNNLNHFTALGSDFGFQGRPPYIELRTGTKMHNASVAEIVQIMQLGVPLDADFVYEILGTEAPSQAPDVFDFGAKSSDTPPPATPPMILPMTNEEGGEARPDRPAAGDDTTPEDEVRAQSPLEDLRNLK